MSRTSPLHWVYQKVAGSILHRATRRRVTDSRSAGLRPLLEEQRPDSRNRGGVWIHAASAGELESLWTVACSFAKQGESLILTAFSASAAAPLQRLAKECINAGGSVITGFSPIEGEWERAFESLRPRILITAKYEAWPDLWAQLSLRQIPLVILGARARRSLLLAKRVCRVFGVALPSMLLLTSGPKDRESLIEEFPKAKVVNTGDPRWDRVAERSARGSDRARELIAARSGLPRPWGILGSVWETDIEIWKDALGEVPGTLWVVPHEVGEELVRRIADRLSETRGPDWALTRQEGWAESSKVESPRTIIVNEVGFLSELYGSADWAYVGGGFGKGVHSTIEPALHGIPIAIGPARAGEFPEITELRHSGQVTVISSSEELLEWLKREQELEQRKRWREEVREHRAATIRVNGEIRSWLERLEIRTP